MSVELSQKLNTQICFKQKTHTQKTPLISTHDTTMTCKNVSVVDYALMSSDLFPLISDFAVLDYCEFHSDVHCPIVLKLNLNEAQETEHGHFESDDDDCLEDADERNLEFITGKPVWCKTRKDEYIFALDDAVINEINIVLDEELLSPEVTSLDTINHSFKNH